jgi:alpha-1,2-mannosyltransferase
VGSTVPTRRLLAAGVAAFGVALAVYVGYVLTHATTQWMRPVDLRVYRDAGLIVRQIRPLYHPHLAAPLYQWPGYLNLKFTYPPFAGMVFTVLSWTSFWWVARISVGVNILALLATIWWTLGGLGYRSGLARAGLTLLLAAPLFWIEPVQRTLFLGQIELVLMALVVWDLFQPDRRWWKGAGVGVAAGIKLVPLIFIPYLLLTRRFRQAAVAAGTFVVTVLLGFAVLPADSRKWWFGGLFLQGDRTGFVGWEGNQSLQGFITRLAGSVASGTPIWLVTAVVVGVAGLVCAAIVDRAGHPVAGAAACALTGLLISPISWDHHWVWIVPITVALVVYAVRAASAAGRWAAAGAAFGLVAVFGAWPGSLWSLPANTGGYFEGLIWMPPVTDPELYFRLGDRPSYAEYHWHGLQLLTGNAYVLAGIALFVLVVVAAVRAVRVTRPGEVSPEADRLTPAAAPPRSG